MLKIVLIAVAVTIIAGIAFLSKPVPLTAMPITKTVDSAAVQQKPETKPN